MPIYSELSFSTTSNFALRVLLISPEVLSSDSLCLDR
jgi:hypothetical protein